MRKKTLLTVSGLILSLVVIISYLYQPALPLSYLLEEYTDQQSKFITIDDTKVHYKIEGDSGDYIILIHGTAASLHTWDDWAKQLRSKYRVLRFDLPAFGLTGPFGNENYSIEHYVTLLKAILTKLEIPKAHIAGNSLGGHIAAQFSLDYPNQVDKLILLNASGLPSKHDSPFIFKIARNPLGAFFIKNTLPKYMIKRNLEAVYFNDSLIEPALIDRYYELALRDGNRQAFIDRANTISKTLKGLDEINANTLIIWGKHDEWIPVDHAYVFEKEIPNSKLLIYDDAGHIPMEEIPEVTVQAVKEFLG